jgi:hypothetical protein
MAFTSSSEAQLILDLRERNIGNPQNIMEILQDSGSSCIHGVGLRLMKFYLDIWHMMPESRRPPLPSQIIIDENPMVKAVGTYSTENSRNGMLYIYDWEGNGQRSHLWYFVKPINASETVKHTGNEPNEPGEKYNSNLGPLYMRPIYDRMLKLYQGSTPGAKELFRAAARGYQGIINNVNIGK